MARNVHLGKLEIDIVAVRGRLLVFCEVRSRRDADERFGSPVDTIGPSKIRKLRRAGARYVAEQRWSGAVRFDAASVVFSPTHPPRIDYFENAFDLLHGGK